MDCSGFPRNSPHTWRLPTQTAGPDRRSRRAHAQPEERRPHAARRDRSIVITGVSGSGKSSLAFDTIYAEGQRRYVESLSAYARQFLERMEKPDVDSHRRHLPGDRHPAEEQHPQSALDGRHDDRDPRLHAAAVRARRAHVLPATAAARSCAKRPRSSPRRLGELPAGHAAADRLRHAGRRAAPRRSTAARGRRADEEATSARRPTADDGAPAPQPVPPDLRRSRSPRRIEALRRKGFGRLLVDGRAVTLDDVDRGARWRDRPMLQVDRRSRAARRRRSRGSGSPIRSRPRTAKAAARRCGRSRRRDRAGQADRASSSPSGSSAARAASRTRIRSRGCSRSTTRSARARPATASATSSSSTWTWSCPIRRSRSSRARSSRGASRTTARSSPS